MLTETMAHNCSLWEADDDCPECLLLEELLRSVPRQARVQEAVLIAIEQIPPFKFLVRYMADFLEEGVRSAEEIIGEVRSLREFYPPSSYAGGVAHKFTLDRRFVKVRGLSL